jgi:hypothetical protein
LASVTAFPSKRVDKKKPPGYDGATVIVQGYDPRDVDINVTVWTEPQYRRLAEMLRTLWPPVKKPSDPDYFRAAFDIQHPALALLRIVKVMIVAVSTLDPGPVAGAMTCKIKCWEWMPPKEVKKKGKVERPANAPVTPAMQTAKNEPHANDPKIPSKDKKTGGPT